MKLKPRSFSKPHLSVKSGPMGIALLSAQAELQHIPLSLRNSISIVGSQDLIDWMDNCKLQNIRPAVGDLNTKSYRRCIRKLTTVEDPESKLRVIAILDYWSQSALRPLHNILADEILGSFEEDCTFNQNKAIAFLDLTKQRYQEFNSLDLTACSDRLPVILQEEILKVMINPEFAAAWKDIMTGYEFQPTWAPSEVIKYSVGQPMGAYSSFPMFTLLHHLIVI